MLLTDKAKQDFTKPFSETISYNYWFENTHETVCLAHIVEWFDSIGYYIGIDIMPHSGRFVSRVFGKEYISNGFISNTRSEALKSAIVKANEIYNSK